MTSAVQPACRLMHCYEHLMQSYGGVVSPPSPGVASPSGVGLPTNSNGLGPITDELRQLPHT